MITDLFFFPNGNVAACREDGQQIPEEQDPAWLVVILDKVKRGVIDPDAKVLRPYYSEMTVREILRSRAIADEIAPI